MSQKNIGALLLLVATALGGPVAVQHAVDVQESVVYSVAIDGPETAEVGELVQLKVNGDRPSWLAPVDDCIVLGDTCIMSFREPGEYEVTAAAVAGRATIVVKHTVTVGRPPEPVVPDPVPTPTPDDLEPKGELTESVYKWCIDANTDKNVAKQLGDNFIYAATNSSDIDELLQKVAAKNRKVKQRTAASVLAQIQQHLYDNLAGEDFDAHQCAFDEIGQGFLKYANLSGHPGFWR